MMLTLKLRLTDSTSHGWLNISLIWNCLPSRETIIRRCCEFYALELWSGVWCESQLNFRVWHGFWVEYARLSLMSSTTECDCLASSKLFEYWKVIMEKSKRMTIWHLLRGVALVVSDAFKPARYCFVSINLPMVPNWNWLEQWDSVHCRILYLAFYSWYQLLTRNI